MAPPVAPPEAPPAPEEAEEEEDEPADEPIEVQLDPLDMSIAEFDFQFIRISLFAQIAYLNFISKFVFLPLPWIPPLPG